MKKILTYYICIVSFVYSESLYAQATIPPVFLCAQTQINGDVILTWIPSAEACGSFTQYTIYASNTFSGPYVVLTTIPTVATTSYTHVGADGNTTTWYYYIEAIYSCPGYTITLTDTLDNLDPVAPDLNYVSVLPAGVQINWYAGTSPETNSYIIYRDNGGFNPIATVYGRFTTSYIDNTASPSTKVETYTIAARDSCNDIGPFNNASHHTLLLNVQQVNCTNQLTLSWNTYDTWTAGVANYEVWVNRNAAGYILQASLPSATITYTYGGFNDGDDICITIHATRADGTAVSFSNEYCAVINTIQPALYAVVRNGTVISNTQNTVEFYPDTNADLKQYAIKRSTDNINFTTLTTQSITLPIPPTIAYTDNSANATSQSYYYTVKTTDSCSNDIQSGYVRTMLLTGTDNADFTNSISWNAFEMTNATLIQYNIYFDSGAGMALINTVSPIDNTYIHDVSGFINTVDHFCYQIEAVYTLNAPENGVNEQLSSFSNIRCVDQGPRIYVPNAIVPTGINALFKPVIVYGESAGYTMQIFNQYGLLIFETTDTNAGWDGTYNNDIVPLGTYAYLIQFTATNGQQITKKGNVTVIR